MSRGVNRGAGDDWVRDADAGIRCGGSRGMVDGRCVVDGWCVIYGRRMVHGRCVVHGRCMVHGRCVIYGRCVVHGWCVVHCRGGVGGGCANKNKKINMKRIEDVIRSVFKTFCRDNFKEYLKNKI